MVVKRTIEVPKMAEQILDVPVPEMVEQKLPETVSDDRIQQRTAEHIADISVPQDVEELVEVFRVPKDRIQQRLAEQTVDTPDISLAEKIVESHSDATGCEHERSASRRHSHPGRDQPGDQAC